MRLRNVKSTNGEPGLDLGFTSARLGGLVPAHMFIQIDGPLFSVAFITPIEDAEALHAELGRAIEKAKANA